MRLSAMLRRRARQLHRDAVLVNLDLTLKLKELGAPGGAQSVRDAQRLASRVLAGSGRIRRADAPIAPDRHCEF